MGVHSWTLNTTSQPIKDMWDQIHATWSWDLLSMHDLSLLTYCCVHLCWEEWEAIVQHPIPHIYCSRMSYTQRMTVILFLLDSWLQAPQGCYPTPPLPPKNPIAKFVHFGPQNWGRVQNDPMLSRRQFAPERTVERCKSMDVGDRYGLVSNFLRGNCVLCTTTWEICWPLRDWSTLTRRVY